MTSFRFLDLPAELRNHIYSLLLDPRDARQNYGEGYSRYRYDLAVFFVNRQIYRESLNVFRQLNIFVRVDTPWDEASQRVALEGNVPVLATGELASKFYEAHLIVEIDAPQYINKDRDSKKFVLLVDDLPAFAKMWFYSDLSYASDLNRHLQLTLRLQNPLLSEATPSGDVSIPNALQEKLLMPFEMVKSLRDMKVLGDSSPAILKRMRDRQAVPYDSPEVCLEEATKLKDAGNVALKTDPRRAIDLYVDAFEKLHIICIGHRRSIWGDPWFDVPLRGGEFDGQHGQVVRLVLRVRLVANIVKAYLDLKEYGEAEFWGMRTINLMREAVGDEDIAFMDFPAANEMGKIYYRVGCAYKHMGDDSAARKMLRVAADYLPNDPYVKRELASVALGLC